MSSYDDIRTVPDYGTVRIKRLRTNTYISTEMTKLDVTVPHVIVTDIIKYLVTCYFRFVKCEVYFRFELKSVQSC